MNYGGVGVFRVDEWHVDTVKIYQHLHLLSEKSTGQLLQFYNSLLKDT